MRLALLVFTQACLVYFFYGPTATLGLNGERLPASTYGPLGLMFLNKIGDWQKYQRCPVTGISFYVSGMESIEVYDSDARNLFKISDYAARLIRHLEENGKDRLACALVQRAISRDVIKGNKNGNPRTFCPVKFFIPPPEPAQ